MGDAQGMPVTADEAQQVLRMRWMVALGAVMAVLCLMLAFTSYQIGTNADVPLIRIGGPVFFLLFGLMWAAGLRRLRARIAVARQILAREQSS